jgi:hypothetical protein
VVGAVDEEDGVTRSRRLPPLPFVAGVGVGVEEVSNNDMISLVAVLRGTLEVAGGTSSFVPKISASKSCVEGPVLCVPLTGVLELDSSPMRSITESLPVRVDPTGLRSLTIWI